MPWSNIVMPKLECSGEHNNYTYAKNGIVSPNGIVVLPPWPPTTHNPQPNDGGNASAQSDISITPQPPTTHDPQLKTCRRCVYIFYYNSLKWKDFNERRIKMYRIFRSFRWLTFKDLIWGPWTVIRIKTLFF